MNGLRQIYKEDKIKNIHNKTIFFEKVFGVNIEDYKTTEEIDKFIAKKRNLNQIRIKKLGYSLVYPRGSIFPIVNLDIEKMVSETVKKIK